ncbi:MAG: thiol reductant ABC exporter subunit CydD [Chloroflexi bacterium]|nr:thiol reductant ABC exporter subunit CydD [Chloroflexota bacterium]
MNLDRRLLKQARLAKAAFIITIAAGFLAGIAAILQARQLSRIISQVFLGGQQLAGVMPLMWLLLGILITRAVLTYLSETSAGYGAVQIKNVLRSLFAKHLLSLGPAYAQGERSGELVNTASQGIEALDAYFSQFLPQLAFAGMLPLAFLIAIFPLDPLSAVVLLVTGPLIPFFMFLIGSMSQTLTRRQWTALSRMSAYFLDTLQGLATLKALGRSREQAGRIEQVSERYRQTTMSVLRVTFLSALVLELLGTIGTAIIAVEIGLRLLYGRISFEPAFFILLLAPDFYAPLRNLGLRFHASMTGVNAARRIFEVLEQPVPEPAAEGAGNGARGSAPRLDRPFQIEFDHVGYTYLGRSQPALEDVSFSIQSGQMTALVGPSGSGKSTLTQLLLCFIKPQLGEIRVNGAPLGSFSVEEWRAQIAWVPQQPHLFYGSVAENLRIAKPDASMDELVKAAEQVHLLEWVESLPQGFDTFIGESGQRLSGGQAQRLALARAVLRDAPLLILDEPTAHLDVVQERILQESTRRLCEGRTVLIIAHRLPTVMRADQILVMQAGRIVEKGSHAELLGNAGLYSRLLADYRGQEVAE